MSLEAALSRWEAALRPGGVDVSEGARAAAECATFATSQRVPAIVRPATVDEVRAVLRIAGEERVVLHPVSRGKNYGLGSRVPPRDGAVLLDLSRMDRILEHDEALAFITVEPGVTFQQAHGYLAARGSRLRLTTIGGPPGASLVGNALERGDGRGPYSDVFAHVCGLEVVLATGEVIRTGMTRFQGARTGPLHRWGLGPALDGLFSQAALGVVTRMTFWLAPTAEHAREVVAKVAETGGLGPMVEAFRELLLEGTLRSNAVLWNDVKAMTAVEQYPFDATGGRTPLPRSELEAFRRRYEGGVWNGASTVFAPDREQGESAARRARKVLEAAGAEVSLEEAAPQGVPSGANLQMAYWRKRTPMPADREPDLDRDGCGFIWVDVAVPFSGAAVGEVVEIAGGLMPLFGFEANLSLLSAGSRCLYLVALILFDREVPGEDERALACQRALASELWGAGYAPARTGVESVGLPLPAATDDSEVVLRRIREALDPAGVLAGGKHGRG